MRALPSRRKNVEFAVDKYTYFTSARTVMCVTVRVGFGFPHAAAIQKITLDA